MELQDWRKEPRKNYSNEFKLRMVELASQPGACVAQIARENGVNDNVIFKWLRLWQNEGRVLRRLPVTTSSDTGVELLPVEITPDEQKEPVAYYCAVFIHFHSDQSQCQFLQGGIPSR
ncbi:transposase [Escherichia coli]|nr:transposase [Escherichia coli]